MTTRPACIFILSAEAAFIAATIAAMAIYPGGALWDASTTVYSFWNNMLSDLGMTVGLNGQANDTGAAVYRAAMLVLVAAMTVFWFTVPRKLAAGRGTARLAAALGVASVLSAVGVALTPSDTLSSLHSAAILLSAALGLSALAVFCRGLFAAWPTRPVVAIGCAVVLLSVTGELALYVWHIAGYRPLQPIDPIVQKLVAMLVLAWMAGATIQTWRVERRAAGERLPASGGG